MLVLSRHRDERIFVEVPGHELIIISLVDIRGDKCRIGVQASDDVIIHREEVHEAIKREENRHRQEGR